jgi:phytanoyl-CoA hydroxylase
MSAATASQRSIDANVHDDLASRFAEDGCLVIRNLIEPARLAAVRQALATETDTVLNAIAAKGLISDTHPELPFERRLNTAGKHLALFGRGWTQNLAGPAVFDLHHDPGLLAVLQRLIGPQINGHRQFNVRPKLPGQMLTTVPWHQDSGYYGPMSRVDTIPTVWIPLVDVDARNGCMQVVPGSNHAGMIDHEKANDEGDFLVLRGEPDPAQVLTVPMRPGDVLVMHNLTWHRSLMNHADTVRWSIDLRFYPPTTPNATELLWGFPEPWVLTGGTPTPCHTWQTWYR